MAKTQIHGRIQIQDNTITNTQIASDAGIQLSKLENIGNGFSLRANSSGILTKVRVVNGEIVNENSGGGRKNFTIDYTPISSTEEVYLNGVLQKPTDDYTISDKTITFVMTPEIDANILVSYQSYDVT